MHEAVANGRLGDRSRSRRGDVIQTTESTPAQLVDPPAAMGGTEAITVDCGNTQSCGRAVARRAKGCSVTDALSISAGELIRSGECESESGRHCAILALTTLYRAIADYLLAP